MNFYCFDSIFLCIYENNHLPNLRILPEFLQFFELIVLDLNFFVLLHPPSRKLMTPIMIINLTFILFLSNYNISYKKIYFLNLLKNLFAVYILEFYMLPHVQYSFPNISTCHLLLGLSLHV